MADADRSGPGRAYARIRTLLLGGILGYLFWQIFAGRDALTSLGGHLSVADAFAALMAAILAYQALLLGWIILLRRTGYYRRGHLADYAHIWWMSYLYRYVPGKVLLVVERARLGARVGIPRSVGAAMPIIETLLAILAGAAVALLSTFHYVPVSPDILVGLGITAAAILACMPLAFALIKRLPLVRERFPELHALELRGSDVMFTAVPFLLHYLLLGLSFFLAVRAVYPLTWTALPGICGVYALSHVIGLVAFFAPGGLGVREGALALQLDKTLPAGIAGTLALGARLWFTAVELLCFGLTHLLHVYVAKPARRTRKG